MNIIDQIADERDKAQQENKQLKARIKRLEAAGDAMEKYIHDQTNTRFIICAIRWRKAKEAKL